MHVGCCMFYDIYTFIRRINDSGRPSRRLVRLWSSVGGHSFCSVFCSAGYRARSVTFGTSEHVRSEETSLWSHPSKVLPLVDWTDKLL